MSEEEKGQAKKDQDSEKPVICESPLLCPEEWEKHPGEKILGEYHKEGTELTLEEADLASFEKYWSSRSEGNLTSEYHKEGAPLLHEAWPGTSQRPVQSQKTEPREEPKVEELATGQKVPEALKAQATVKEGAEGRTTIERPIDVHTIEVISYAIVRALFSQGISVPIKREGIIDMELRVRGKDIILDTKELFPITVPELVVWRVIYAYKGKPVIEMGHGVKKGLKIHKYRGFVMLIDVWRGNRRLRITKKKMEKAKQRGEAV